MIDLKSCSNIKIDNEDDSYNKFIQYLDHNKLVDIKALRCHKKWPPVTVGNRLKKHSYGFEPDAGEYLF